MAEKKTTTTPKSVLVKRERGANLRVGTTEIKRKVAASKNGKQFASAGPRTSMTNDGMISDVLVSRVRQMATQGSPFGAQGWGMYELTRQKTAALFSDGTLGNADIADSNNIGYYSYEFPVDALELPASRAEELRFYRLAYDRDPIVGRAIDMHTELPLSKWALEKPKCSSDDFADYVYDFYQGLISDTKFFQVLIQAVREYWTIGEAFIFIQEAEPVEPSKLAKAQIEKAEAKNKKRPNAQSTEPGMEGEGSMMGGTSDAILDFLQPEKRSSWLKKKSAIIQEIKKAGIKFNLFSPDETITNVKNEIRKKKISYTKKAANIKGFIKLAMDNKESKLISRDEAEDDYPIQVKVAAPPDAAAPPPAGGERERPWEMPGWRVLPVWTPWENPVETYREGI